MTSQEAMELCLSLLSTDSCDDWRTAFDKLTSEEQRKVGLAAASACYTAAGLVGYARQRANHSGTSALSNSVHKVACSLACAYQDYVEEVLGAAQRFLAQKGGRRYY